MTKRHTIDWRTPFRSLEPYVAGRGGLICVTGGPTSAWSIFLELVRESCRAASSSLDDIKINPVDETTRGPDDIIAKLESRLHMSQIPPSAVTVASNVRAGGNVSISQVEVSSALSPYEVSVGRRDRERRIVAHLDTVLPGRRCVMFLHGCSELPPRTSSWFWETLWSENLAPLARKGFLLICVCETMDGSCKHGLTKATPDCRVALPDLYTEKGRDEALEDIAAILSTYTGEDEKMVRGRADTLLKACEYRPAGVHSAVNAFVLEHIQSRTE
jgi:hypothetical protein